ncbi:MAG: hypothetical protein U0Z75_01755 [Deinococcaceae bacterium]
MLFLSATTLAQAEGCSDDGNISGRPIWKPDPEDFCCVGFALEAP